MSEHVNNFAETKNMSFLTKDVQLSKDAIKSGIKSEILLTKIFISRQWTVKNIKG